MFYPTVDDVGAPDAMLDGLKGGDPGVCPREFSTRAIGDLLGRETGEYLALGIKEPRVLVRISFSASTASASRLATIGGRPL